MTWSRGLFRIWVVASVSWIALLLYFDAPDNKGTYIRYLNYDNTLGMDPNGSGLWTPATRIVLTTEVLAWVEDRWSPTERSVKIEQLERLEKERRARDLQKRQRDLPLFAIGVPMFLLLLGLMARWVLQGFKKQAL